MKPYAIGIDVGGSKLAAGLIDQRGTVLNRYFSQAHAEKEPEFVIEAIEASYHTLLEQSGIAAGQIEAVGLGFAGNTNGPAGMVLISSNLPAWHNYPLRDVVAARLGRPVYLENDANLAALGEFHYGAGRGSQNMVYVTLSTGYGIGLIINGRLYVGQSGMAGELGHVVIDIGGPACTCGKRGCVMAYASGIGLARMAEEQIRAGAKTVLRLPAGGRRLSGEAVAEAAQQGDQVALELLKTAGYYAGVGVSMIIQILNPERIVIGGGLTRIGRPLLDQVERAMVEHTQPQMLSPGILVPWQLGDDLVLIGAAARVFAG
jgi:glucokinase